jgi:HEAT repeats
LEEGNTTQSRPPWKRIAIISSLCLFGIGILALVLRAKEPDYNGKNLSAWIDSYVTPTNYSQQAQAVTAIRSIGPKALPWLLGWSHYQTPIWQTKLAERFKRLGFDWPTHFIDERSRRRAAVWSVLAVLGPRANPAIPEITQIAIKSSTEEAECALIFLSQRPEAVPALLRVITEGKRELRLRAMHYVGQVPNLGTNGTAAVAVLLKCLKEDDETIAASAARALGSVALETKAVIPALTPLLRDPRRDVSYSASYALGNLANHRAAIPDLLAALPDLIAAQQHSNHSVREWATNVLWKIAPEVLTNGAKDYKY